MIQEKAIKKSPPYSSISALKQLFELLSTRSLKSVDRGYLGAYGIAGSEGFVAISTLRFLGLIDKSGNATDLVKKFHLQGEAKIKELESIIRSAYTEIFERAPGAASFEPNELINEFVATYKLSPRVAGPAARDFIWFCEEAGLREKRPESESKIRSTKAKTVNRIPKATKGQANIIGTNRNVFSEEEGNPSVFSESGSLIKQVYPIEGGVEIRVPRTDKVSEAILKGELSEVFDALKRFSIKTGLIVEKN